MHGSGDNPMMQPLGGADHRPFLGFSDELVYGRRPDGAMIHVSQAERGLACGCVCPACEGVLWAKKGNILKHHFSHAGESCGGGPETNAHIWAKEVLEREKWLMLPAVMARFGPHAEERFPARAYRFDSVTLERRLGSIVPDVILVTKTGAQLIVEVKVTHGCEPAKLEVLHSEKLSAIEIDLSRYRISKDRAAIEHALLQRAGRIWLENARQEEFDAELRKDIERQEREMEQRLAAAAAQATARAKESERRAQIREEQRYEQMVRAALGRRTMSDDEQEFVEITFTKIDRMTPIRINAVGFPQGDALWQATLLDRLLSLKALEEGYCDEQFSLDDAYARVEHLVVPAVRAGMTGALETRYRIEHADKIVPKYGVSLFLKHLARAGYLYVRGEDAYSVHIDYSEKVLAAARGARQHEYRLQRLREEVARLLQLAKKAAAGTLYNVRFDFEEWIERDLGWGNETALAACRSDAEMFEQLLGRLRKVDIMLTGGPLTADLLGLPLEPAADALAARKREKELAAARERRAALEEAARKGLEEDAENWLVGTSENDSKIARSELAFRSSIGFQRMRAELEREVARCRLADRCRSALRHSAAKVLSSEKLDLFLRATHPKLGMSPAAYCIDQRTLRECVLLLPAAKGR